MANKTPSAKYSSLDFDNDILSLMKRYGMRRIREFFNIDNNDDKPSAKRPFLGGLDDNLPQPKGRGVHESWYKAQQKSGGKVRKKKSGGKVYTTQNKRYAHGGKVSGRKAKYNG